MVDEKWKSSEKVPIRPSKEQIASVKEDLDRLNQEQIVELYTALKLENIKLHDLNETLRNMAGTDSLTGLSNRAGLLTQFNSIVNTLNRQKHNGDDQVGFEHYSILFLDLVGLEDINDKIGYEEGDKLIKRGADTILMSAQRGTDIVSRWGGDEYVVVLVNTTENNALNVADKIHENLLENVKFNIVVGEFNADDDILESINKAGESLKYAKDSGLKDVKNRSLGIGLVTLDKNEK